MSQKQRTLASAFDFQGKGLHTAIVIKMTVKPAAAGHGIKFARTDLEGCPTIDALAENVKETSRSTVLEKGQVRVSTVEHILASLWGCSVDNALIEVDGPEVPIADGSAIKWVEAIEKVGTVEQDADRKFYDISEKLTFSDPERGVEIVAYPDSHFSATVNIDFDSKVIGKQFATLNCCEDFAKEIAPCRTFVFLHDIEPLIKHNLIKGGDLNNAIVIIEKPMDKQASNELASMLGIKEFDAQTPGYINDMELRFDNEIARHKMLDLVGDLALIGVRIKGHVMATKPGHYANTEFAKVVRKAIKADESKPPFKYDPNATPVYDINQIRSILPHRPPFLLVDKIMYCDHRSIVGIKQVTMNEPFFVGHFPEEPVMPGVLHLEAMAQCGGILALGTLPDPENYSTYFMTIDAVKYRRKVVPGDTLMFTLELTEPIRRGIVKMSAKAYIGDTLATEAQLMAMITKNKK